MNQAMTDLMWTPEQIGKLTLPQLVCLTHKKPPGRPSGAMPPGLSGEQLAAHIDRQRADTEEAWRL